MWNMSQLCSLHSGKGLGKFSISGFNKLRVQMYNTCANIKEHCRAHVQIENNVKKDYYNFLC